MLDTVKRRLRRARRSRPEAGAYECPEDDRGDPAVRILVVDDDADLREAIAFTLKSAGFAVATAADGPTALTTVAAARPDLVVLDVMMPGPSGIEVCRQPGHGGAAGDTADRPHIARVPLCRPRHWSEPAPPQAVRPGGPGRGDPGVARPGLTGERLGRVRYT
jgi:hypothetical protein